MSGKKSYSGGKGLGKGGAKRHGKKLRDNIQGVTAPAIRRLCRRGGVKRISGLVYEETRGVLKLFLEGVIRDSVTYTEHARRKTVTAMDVVYSLKRQNRTIYGYDTPQSSGPTFKSSKKHASSRPPPHAPAHMRRNSVSHIQPLQQAKEEFEMLYAGNDPSGKMMEAKRKFFHQLIEHDPNLNVFGDSIKRKQFVFGSGFETVDQMKEFFRKEYIEKDYTYIGYGSKGNNPKITSIMVFTIHKPEDKNYVGSVYKVANPSNCINLFDKNVIHIQALGGAESKNSAWKLCQRSFNKLLALQDFEDSRAKDFAIFVGLARDDSGSLMKMADDQDSKLKSKLLSLYEKHMGLISVAPLSWRELKGKKTEDMINSTSRDELKSENIDYVYLPFIMVNKNVEPDTSKHIFQKDWNESKFLQTNMPDFTSKLKHEGKLEFVNKLATANVYRPQFACFGYELPLIQTLDKVLAKLESAE
jgi:histone H4